MDDISTELKKRLQATSRQLLVHALEHALTKEPTENDVIQTIVNLQASLELLSKLYVLRREGWKFVIDPKFHSQKESELLAAISTGTIKTIPFWKSRELAAETLYLNDDDLQLLDNFQNRRNQIMHLGLTSPSHEILNEAIWFLVRIVQQLDWKEYLPIHQQYLSNSLMHVIGTKLFKKLVTNTCYVNESIDRAYELYPDSVTYCFECGNETLVITDADDYLCFVCGFQVDTDAMGLIDCPVCKATRSLAFDLLNIECNEKLDGKCCRCKTFVSVSRCKTCETDYATEQGCDLCRG
ncbi:MAG: hypothetical protein DU481_06680 [Nitrosomonas sp.]|uniref:hypothetical protein n=1 Tax=Nitrosomonas sp. TaxID=42353 RepID=UPI0032EE59D0